MNRNWGAVQRVLAMWQRLLGKRREARYHREQVKAFDAMPDWTMEDDDPYTQNEERKSL